MKILEFPQLRQTFEWDCGAKALQSVLVYYGIEIREELLIQYAETNSEEGTSRANMIRVLEKYALHTEAKSMTIEDLRTYIDAETPILILIQAWSEKNIDYTTDFHDGHWAVAIGYDKNTIIFEDPYSFQKVFLSNTELENRWHSEEDGEKVFHYGIAVFGKDPSYDSSKIIHMD